MSSIRVRFAPSPTGPLHIGGVRTALYNYFLAKKSGGTFVLRIEDTDQKRYVAGAEEYILETMNWLGLHIEEGPTVGGNFGPYRQSERKDIYSKYIRELLDDGKAYYAFDTPEELDQMRERLTEAGVAAPKYDHTVRMSMKNALALGEEETKRLLEASTPAVVRLLVQPGKTVKFDDIVRGEVSFNTDNLDDKVLMKADGLPTYHMANIVDDYCMKISHVIRGEEWLSSTPHHVLLYEAFGWLESMPQFAHLPLIMKPNGKGKLSKRDGQKMGIPVFPLDWIQGEDHFDGFREKGFLSQAVINFLAFLGWNPGTEQEIFTMEELVQSFELEKVQKSGARFDYDKAKWFNQQHIINLTVNELLPMIKSTMPDGQEASDEYLTKAIRLMQPRMQSLGEFWSDSEYLFDKPKFIDEKNLNKKYKEENRAQFENMLDQILQADLSIGATYANLVKGYIKDNELKFGDILPIFRIGIAGTLQGPDLFEMMALLGKDEVYQRMKSLLLKMDSKNNDLKKPDMDENIKKNPGKITTLDININEFGEIKKNLNIEEINKFLNKTVVDKKIAKNQIEEE